MNNPFLERGKHKQHGQRAEKKAAKRLKGQLTPASGALDGAKGDFHLKEFLVENKATEKKSMGLELQWLAKIAQEAVDHGKYPALSMQFVTLDGQPKQDGAWVAIPEYVFKELLENNNES